ncbi:hypothetical protein JCM8208_005324 [Rhodotorula glutinis]
MPPRWPVLELLAAAVGAALLLLAHASAAPLPTTSSISRVCSLVRLDGHVLDELVDEVCETLTDADSTLNIVSENEPVGVDYEGDGLLDGVALSINPSILSGIFQTTTRTQASAIPRPTATNRAIAVEGQGLLDGVDITLDPSLLRGLANAPSLLKSMLVPSRTASAGGASETGACEA